MAPIIFDIEGIFARISEEGGSRCPGIAELAMLEHSRIVELAEEMRHVAGTRDFINFLKLRRHRLAVASTLWLADIRLALSVLALTDQFDVIASATEVQRGRKSSRDLFRLTAERLKVSPGSCIVLESNMGRMEAARDAGMHCVALVNDMRENYPAELIVEDLRKIPLWWFER